MPQTQGINTIFQNNSFIIITAQGNFHHILCENVMISTPEKALFSRLAFPRPQTFQKVFMSQTFVYHRFFQSFGFLFFPVFRQERIKFWSQRHPLRQNLSIAFIFHQPNLFLVFFHDWQPFQNSRVIFRVFICVKPFRNISGNIFEKIVGFNFQNQRIRIGIQNFCLLLFLFHVFILEGKHQSF